jgi:hypothetical protein
MLIAEAASQRVAGRDLCVDNISGIRLQLKAGGLPQFGIKELKHDLPRSSVSGP